MASLVPLRTLIHQGCLTAARAVCVASLRPSALAISNQVEQLSTQTQGSCNQPQLLQYPSQARAFHATSGCNAGLEVKVPALGESITDGTISTLLKQPGDAVSEDEPIVQIETDKVTIDVRSPQAGFLERFLVKPDDTVVVGQPMAIISSEQGAAAAALEPATEAAAPAPPTPPSAAAAPAPPQPPRQQQPAPSFAAAAAAAAPKRKPSIKFPPRRTDAGEVLSMMPAAQAREYVAAAVKAAELAVKPRPTIAPMFQKSGPPLPRPPRQLVRPAPQVPRSAMSDREMELIMLGGADP